MALAGCDRGDTEWAGLAGSCCRHALKRSHDQRRDAEAVYGRSDVHDRCRPPPRSPPHPPALAGLDRALGGGERGALLGRHRPRRAARDRRLAFVDRRTTNDEASAVWRENFVRTYLERDIPQLGPRVPAETLRRFWTMLAHLQGGTLNAAQLARGLAVDGKTIGRYLDLLVDLLLVRRLAPLGGWRKLSFQVTAVSASKRVPR